MEWFKRITKYAIKHLFNVSQQGQELQMLATFCLCWIIIFEGQSDLKSFLFYCYWCWLLLLTQVLLPDGLKWYSE